jgi:hypothetical protein
MLATDLWHQCGYTACLVPRVVQCVARMLVGMCTSFQDGGGSRAQVGTAPRHVFSSPGSRSQRTRFPASCAFCHSGCLESWHGCFRVLFLYQGPYHVTFVLPASADARFDFTVVFTNGHVMSGSNRDSYGTVALGSASPLVSCSVLPAVCRGGLFFLQCHQVLPGAWCVQILSDYPCIVSYSSPNASSVIGIGGRFDTCTRMRLVLDTVSVVP